MSVQSIDLPRPFGLTGMFAEFHRREPLFASAAIFVASLALPMGAAALLDSREIAGVGIWDKPLKFVLALTVYLATLAWYAGYLSKGALQKRWVRWHSRAVVFAVIAELAVIAGAAAFGTTSHFNDSTVAWQIAYALMGVGAVLLTSASTVQGWLMRGGGETLSPVVKAGLVWGLLLTLPLTLATAGVMSASGSHLVGGNLSDAESTLLMGWARDGGDLRVAHFFASHALHFLPGFALISAALFGRADKRPLMIFTALFIGFVALVFAQALAGQPFLAGWI